MPKKQEKTEKDVRALMVAAEDAFDQTETAQDVRAVFKHYFGDLGWKRLCRLFVLDYGADDLWLDEQDRAAKRETHDGPD